MASLALSWFVALAIATPHVLYAYIWFFPDRWRAAFKSRSVEVFHNAAWALKGASLKHAPSLLPTRMLQHIQHALTAWVHVCRPTVQQHRGMAPARAAARAQLQLVGRHPAGVAGWACAHRSRTGELTLARSDVWTPSFCGVLWRPSQRPRTPQCALD